jgi:hypothetical protein
MDLDGVVESKTDIGRSDAGFHFRISSTDNRTFDNDPVWSKAYPNRESAEIAASEITASRDNSVVEDRFSEITRKYSEAVRSDERAGPTAITKPADLESYRQEVAYRTKHDAHDAWASLAAAGRQSTASQQADLFQRQAQQQNGQEL